jgi:hypothetical protein
LGQLATLQAPVRAHSYAKSAHWDVVIKEWTVVSFEILVGSTTACACKHAGLVNVFHVVNKHTRAKLQIGSTCVDTFFLGGVEGESAAKFALGFLALCGGKVPTGAWLLHP